MKVERVVLWNFREDISEAEKQRIIDQERTVLTKIPGVENLSVGMAVRPEERYRCYVVIRLTDRAALAVFDADSTHQAYVNDEFGPSLADELVLTYEMQS